MKKIIFLFGLLFPYITQAHVGYVIDEADRVLHAGPDMPFLLSALKDPINSMLMLGTIVLCGVVFWVCEKSDWVQKHVTTIQNHTKTYGEYIPWMLRLSLGIALLGAGTSSALVSPLLSANDLISLAQIILGFLILSGFLVGFATLASIALYITALFSTSYIFGNLDFLGIAFAILLLADSRPGIDDIFGFPFIASLSKWKQYAPVVVRMGIGFAMTYLAIYEKFLNPDISELVINKFNMTAGIPVSPAMWVLSAGLIELAVGLLLIIGWRPRLVSAIAFLVLTSSFFFFKEAVYSHITLFGSLSVIFASGGKKMNTV